MTTKILIYIILMCAFEPVRSQERNINSLLEENSTNQSFDTLLCQKYFKKCELDLVKSSPILPFDIIMQELQIGEVYFPSKTYLKLLEIENKFRTNVTVGSISDFSNGEEECYSRCIYNHYGKNFFIQKINEADSLDSLNLGYISASPPQGFDLTTFIKNNSIEDLDKDFNKKFQVEFIVNKKGRMNLSSIYELKGINNISLSKRDLLYKKIRKVSRRVPNFTPAQFRGKAIEDRIFVSLE